MNELKLDGKIIGDQYQIRGKISSGSFAEVFVARNLRSDAQNVVFKALNTSLQGPSNYDLDVLLQDNFDQEALILETISNPHIISMLDSGEDADLDNRVFPFIILEYMEGGDLLRFSRDQAASRLDLGQTLNYFRQICDGLSHAHERGIIHRDLKPNNLLLSADHQSVKIADFGIAKFMSDEIAEITQIGTDLYSPPEHSPTSTEATVGGLTATADVYSLAKSCFALICGRTPSEFARKPITVLPPAIREYPWAGSLLDILKRATESLVEARYGSVSEFWNDLADLAKHDLRATSQASKRRISPEERETAKKRAELAPLEAMLAQRELDLATLQTELQQFELRYLRTVGARYAELDELEAQIAESEARSSPNDTDAQARAAQARAQANESADTANAVEGIKQQEKFKPSDSLKKLFREPARLLHPDLALNEEEKARRHELMARANKAYAEGDEELLASMLDEWQNSPDAIKGDTIGAELIRLIRSIAQAEERLTVIEKEIVALQDSDLYRLKSKVELAELKGRDLLEEMAAQIDIQIAEKRKQFDDEEQTKLRNG